MPRHCSNPFFLLYKDAGFQLNNATCLSLFASRISFRLTQILAIPCKNSRCANSWVLASLKKASHAKGHDPKGYFALHQPATYLITSANRLKTVYNIKWSRCAEPPYNSVSIPDINYFSVFKQSIPKILFETL